MRFGGLKAPYWYTCFAGIYNKENYNAKSIMDD
jgi:hypothetical protein